MITVRLVLGALEALLPQVDPGSQEAVPQIKPKIMAVLRSAELRLGETP